MILEYNEFQQLTEFINLDGELGQNAKRAWEIYRDNEDKDDYVVIRVNSYYCITKITDEFNPIEVRQLVQPFDEKKVYPLQFVEKKIDWVR